MTTDFKTHIYLTRQDQIIYWCFMLISLFGGLIIQLEATKFSLLGMIFWILAIVLTLYGLFGYQLTVQENQIILQHLFFKKKKVAFDNIKEINVFKNNVRIKMINPKYLRYNFLIVKKNRNKLMNTFEKNHVKILPMENGFQ